MHINNTIRGHKSFLAKLISKNGEPSTNANAITFQKHKKSDAVLKYKKYLKNMIKKQTLQERDVISFFRLRSDSLSD